MTVTSVCYLSTLMRLARAAADAREHGTPEQVKVAEDAHECYRQVCLTADYMVTGVQP